MAEPVAPALPGTALSDCARRNPSEIPSRTQSVSAFLPGKVSMGTPFLRRITLQGMPSRRHVSHLKVERRRAASKPVAFNASPHFVGCPSSEYLANLECPCFLRLKQLRSDQKRTGAFKVHRTITLAIAH